MSCDPGTLITSARCLLNCIPAGLQSAAQTAMLTSINGGETNLNTLMQQAKEFIWRVPPMYQTPLQIYLLLVILEGTNRSVDELLRSASCMRCIPKGYLPPIQTSELCEWNEGGGGGCNNPIVLDWLQRMANNGVTLPDPITIQAVCDFCNDLDTYGLTDKMLVVNPVIPDSLSAMRYPLIWQTANGMSPFMNFNFVAADLDENGILGNGTSKYMDTGFNAQNQWISPDSSGITIYESDQSSAAFGDEYEFGIDDTAGTATVFWLGTFIASSNDAVGSGWQIGTSAFGGLAADTPAFYSLNRSTVTFLGLYSGRSTLVGSPVLLGADPTDQSGSLIPDGNCVFMALNNGFSIANFSSKRVSFCAVHEGLTNAEVDDFYAAVQSLRIGLGGGWV